MSISTGVRFVHSSYQDSNHFFFFFTQESYVFIFFVIVLLKYVVKTWYIDLIKFPLHTLNLT